MNLTKKERTIKYLIYCLLILASALIQNVSSDILQIGRARCFFLIPVAVSLGIDEDERGSALLGFVAGLLWDSVSAQHMGFNFVFLVLVCYVSSSLVSYLIRPTYWVSVLASVFASGLYLLSYWIIFVAFSGTDGALASLRYFYFPSFVYTAIVSLIIARLLIPLKSKLNKETNI